MHLNDVEFVKEWEGYYYYYYYMEGTLLLYDTIRSSYHIIISYHIVYSNL
jgi:hypothetical protein